MSEMDFPTFRSGVTSVFVKKKRLTHQKVFPLPTVGAPAASKSPSASRAGWIISMLIIWDVNGNENVPFRRIAYESSYETSLVPCQPTDAPPLIMNEANGPINQISHCVVCSTRDATCRRQPGFSSLSVFAEEDFSHHDHHRNHIV